MESQLQTWEHLISIGLRGGHICTYVCKLAHLPSLACEPKEPHLSLISTPHVDVSLLLNTNKLSERFHHHQHHYKHQGKLYKLPPSNVRPTPEVVKAPGIGEANDSK